MKCLHCGSEVRLLVDKTWWGGRVYLCSNSLCKLAHIQELSFLSARKLSIGHRLRRKSFLFRSIYDAEGGWQIGAWFAVVMLGVLLVVVLIAIITAVIQHGL